MPNKFHRNLLLDNLHAIAARVYPDIASRDADTDFQIVENINKVVRVDSPASIWLLLSATPATWTEFTSTSHDTFLELTDTPSAYEGAGKVTQTNASDDGLEFGQTLRPTDSPTFASTSLTQGIDTPIRIEGSGTPTTDASLDLKANDKAFLPNQLTTTQRDALTKSPGMSIYHTTASQWEGWNGAAWMNFGSGGGDVVGPISSVNESIPIFDGTTGKVLKDASGVTINNGDVSIESGNMTLATHQVGTRGDDVVEVWVEADLGTIDPGVKITMDANMTYKIMAPITLTLPLFVQTGASNQIITTNRALNTITFTHLTAAMFNGTNINTLALMDIVVNGNSTGILFDIDGGVLSFKFPDFNRFLDLGMVQNLTDFFGPGILFDVIEDGLDIINCATCTFVECLGFGLDGNTFNLFNVSGVSSGDLQFYNNMFENDSFSSFMHIDGATYPNGKTVNIAHNNVLSNFWGPGSIESDDVRVISRGNKGVADSTANADIGALDEGGTQTLLDQDQVQRIIGTFSEVTSERFTTDAAGIVEYEGLDDISVSILSTITGTSSSGININMNFYVVKGSTLNTITAFADAGGGQVTVTTSVAHGWSNGDRIIIEDTTNYNGEYTISNITADTYEITATFVATETGTNAKVIIATKASNDFSGSNKNTTLIAQLPIVTNDFMYIGVENSSTSAEWNLEDIHELYAKV